VRFCSSATFIVRIIGQTVLLNVELTFRLPVFFFSDSEFDTAMGIDFADDNNVDGNLHDSMTSLDMELQRESNMQSALVLLVTSYRI